jgi:hypothetical protein
MIPPPIDLQSSICLSGANDLNEESEVDTSDTGKSKNSVSGSVDALDGKTWISAPNRQYEIVQGLTLAHIPHQMPNSIVGM